ncbi:hypothetical protein SLA_2422 [Streptomyces laurentii]|uniref:Minor tail protein n=1 Tax=Streptomyces laurentii TaxID=39478 RepID=A0A160NX52_STRLU|nr:hypothetical protein SLA_2422 [Streptomyces laurentii]
MSRYDYGAGVADFVVAPADGIWTVGQNIPVTFWSQQTEGTQYTDLLDVDNNPVNHIISNEFGALPRFRGPDGVAGMWADAGGGSRAWLYAHVGGQGTPGDPGAHWYFGEGSPDEAALTPPPVPGDLYLDTSTGAPEEGGGDLYTYNGAVWTLRANIRGPQGSGGDSAVTSVNGQTGAVNLAATDVGALAASSAGQPSGTATLDATGRVPASQLPPVAADLVQSVNGQTGAVNLAAADVGALASTARATANGVASLDGTTRIPIAQMPTAVAKNTWTPQALGFQAWTCDPYTVANPVAKYLTPQRLYVCGVNITESTQVNRIIMFARGYGGVSADRYAAGIYRENGTKVASTSAPVSLAMATPPSGSPPQMATNHIGATPISLPSTVTLTPGRYWLTWVLTTGAATDYAFYHVQNEAPVAPANFFFGTPFARAWYLAAQADTPGSLNQAAAGVLTDHDIPIMALAMV